MVTFSLMAAILLIVALAFVLPPLLRNRGNAAVLAQKDLTVTVYQDQLLELDNDLKNGAISQEQYQQAKSDIEHNLLQDVELAEARAKAQGGAKPNRLSALAVGVFVPVLSVILYGLWGAGADGLDPKNATPVVKAEQHQEQNIEDLLEQLLARLQAQPDDLEGWYMLGRTYQYLQRFPEAVEAFDRAVKLGGDRSADILSSYADALALASGRQLTADAVQLLEQALKVDPFHAKSLWLAGTAAYQNRQYTIALQYWERLLTLLPAGSEDARQITANINETRSLAGLPPMMSQTEGATSTAVTAVINGRVSLDSSLASKVDPEDTVFVFARAAEGPRMPLAIVRKQVKDLPFDFTLDDSMAMNPMMSLSSFPTVVVGARISKTGNAMPQTGDLEGYSAKVLVAANNPVEILIDAMVP